MPPVESTLPHKVPPSDSSPTALLQSKVTPSLKGRPSSVNLVDPSGPLLHLIHPSAVFDGGLGLGPALLGILGLLSPDVENLCEKGACIGSTRDKPEGVMVLLALFGLGVPGGEGVCEKDVVLFLLDRTESRLEIVEASLLPAVISTRR
jgi:hypothetical protein